MKKLIASLIALGPAGGEILYETDFDSFPTGPNQWSSASEWLSNDEVSGAQSIDDGLISGLLKTASLGFATPVNTFTTVFLDLGFDPATAGSGMVEIDSLLGIEDSTNDRRDDFFLTFYNGRGERLASIRFDNDSPEMVNSQFGIWRETTTQQFDTGIDFVPGELFNFFATIDLENNTWSADVDGLPLFEDAVFTDQPGLRDLGFVAFEWDLTALSPAAHGDNFLVVADLIIRQPPIAPLPVTTANFAVDGTVTLSWQTAPGWTDQVQFSSDLVTWDSSLPHSLFPSGAAPAPVNFTAPSTDAPRRFYRVRRFPE